MGLATDVYRYVIPHTRSPSARVARRQIRFGDQERFGLAELQWLLPGHCG